MEYQNVCVAVYEALHLFDIVPTCDMISTLIHVQQLGTGLKKGFLLQCLSNGVKRQQNLSVEKS